MSTCYEEVDDLKKIKKEYGEQMAHLCRSLFPTILEQKGLLYYAISSTIPKSKDFYYDLINEHKEYEFKKFIYSICDTKGTSVTPEDKTVQQLLDEAGYELFECENNDDIQKFKKYYAPGEELCTFKDSHRIKDHHIFFIVKKNVEQIKRDDFKNPSREDEYSTSVLDLQFDKGETQRVSIKSRYNHTVTNPDATYGNNLDKIIPGLTSAFEREYGLKISTSYITDFYLEDYEWARDGKYYKFNYEINNIHYCTNNIILDNGEVIDTYSDKSRYTFMDYFILDEQNKKIFTYDKKLMGDGFLKGLENIKNIEISNRDGYKEVKLYLDDEKTAIIKLDSRGRIIGYINESLEKADQDFLTFNKTLSELELPNLKKSNDRFLINNQKLEAISLPNLKECGDNFLQTNYKLQNVNLPNLKKCGNCFLMSDRFLKVLDLPNLTYCGSYFLYNGKELEDISLPNLKECKDNFLYFNNVLDELYLPSIELCGRDFMGYNDSLVSLKLPNLKECASDFISVNTTINTVILSSLEKCGDFFLKANRGLKELYLSNLKECGDYFISTNEVLDKIDLSMLNKCGDHFLESCQIKRIDLLNLTKCGNFFLDANYILEEINAPKLCSVDKDFLLMQLTFDSSFTTLIKANVSRLYDTNRKMYNRIMDTIIKNVQYYENMNTTKECSDLESTKPLVLKRTKK